MKQIINAYYAGKSLMTADGPVEFDENGVAQVENDDTADAIAALPNFAIYDAEDAPDTPDDNDPSQGDEGDGEQHEDGQDDENEDDTPAPAPGEPLDIDALNKMTVPALRKMAKDAGLDIEGKTTKADFIRLLTEAAQ